MKTLGKLKLSRGMTTKIKKQKRDPSEHRKEAH